MLHKGYTKFIMPAGIMSSASINIIRSNPIISADLSGLSVIRSFIIRMNPVYDKTDGGLNGFHRSTSLCFVTWSFLFIFHRICDLVFALVFVYFMICNPFLLLCVALDLLSVNISDRYLNNP